MISDGPMSDDSGTLFIKPCTHTEISFYETATAEHPELAGLMPTFHGKLDLLGKVDTDSNGKPLEEAMSSITASVVAQQQQTTPGAPAHLLSRSQTQPRTSQPKLHKSNTVANDGSTSNVTSPRKAFFGKPLDTPLCIVLEDVATHFQRPNILDLKLGTRLWDDDAPPEKRARLDKVASQTTSKSLGFRISGMRVWKGDTDSRGGDDRVIERTGTGLVDSERDHNSDIDFPDSSSASATAEKVAADGSKDVENATSSSAAAAAAATESATIIHEPDTGYTFYNKLYGRTFNADTVTAGFRAFLCPEIPIRTYAKSAKRSARAETNPTEANCEDGAKNSPDIPTASADKSQGPLHRARTLTSNILADVRHIIHVLEHEETRMFSSSILIVYEGDPDLLEPLLSENDSVATKDDNNGASDKGERQTGKADGEPSSPSSSRSSSMSSSLSIFTPKPKSHAVKLIDFAHSSWAPGQGPDEHMLHGVRNVAGVLERLVAELDEEIGG